MKHLNRILKWTNEGITYETDLRHVDIIIKALGVTKPVTRPMVCKSPDEADAKDKPLSDEEATLYRSCTIRIRYLA